MFSFLHCSRTIRVPALSMWRPQTRYVPRFVEEVPRRLPLLLWVVSGVGPEALRLRVGPVEALVFSFLRKQKRTAFEAL